MAGPRTSQGREEPDYGRRYEIFYNKYSVGNLQIFAGHPYDSDNQQVGTEIGLRSVTAVCRDQRITSGTHDGSGDSRRLIAGKAPQATRNQAIDLQAAILSGLRKRNGGMVGEGAPARWCLARLEEAAN
jgi:hypothetical protein